MYKLLTAATLSLMLVACSSDDDNDPIIDPVVDPIVDPVVDPLVGFPTGTWYWPTYLQLDPSEDQVITIDDTFVTVYNKSVENQCWSAIYGELTVDADGIGEITGGPLVADIEAEGGFTSLIFSGSYEDGLTVSGSDGSTDQTGPRTLLEGDQQTAGVYLSNLCEGSVLPEVDVEVVDPVEEPGPVVDVTDEEVDEVVDEVVVETPLEEV